MKILPIILLLISQISFGATFSMTRIAMDEGIPFFGYIFWASLGALILLSPVVIIRGDLSFPSWSKLRFFLAGGIFGLVLPYSMLAVIAPRVPPATLSLVITLAPIITYCIAVSLKMDRFRWVRIAGIAAGFGGVLCVLLPKTSLPDSSTWIWMLIALTVPLSFAIVAILAALLRPSTMSSYESAFGLLTVATLIMTPIMAASGQIWVFSGPMTGGDWSLIGYIIVNAGFYVLLFEIVRLAGPVFFSSGNFIATLSGVIWAIIVFGELPNYWIWIALVLLSVGLFLVNWTNTRAASTEA